MQREGNRTQGGGGFQHRQTQGTCRVSHQLTGPEPPGQSAVLDQGPQFPVAHTEQHQVTLRKQLLYIQYGSLGQHRLHALPRGLGTGGDTHQMVTGLEKSRPQNRTHRTRTYHTDLQSEILHATILNHETHWIFSGKYPKIT